MRPCISVALLGLLGIAVSVSEAKPRSSCPPGWFFYKANCYGYFRFRLTWSEAESECASYGHGAHLASIMDEAEASIIASNAGAYGKTLDIWIGLHDPEKIRRWRWADGSMYNYRAWKDGEPNNLQNAEYCGELTKETNYHQWNDAPCTEQNNFVCKYKP